MSWPSVDAAFLVAGHIQIPAAQLLGVVAQYAKGASLFCSGCRVVQLREACHSGRPLCTGLSVKACSEVSGSARMVVEPMQTRCLLEAGVSSETADGVLAEGAMLDRRGASRVPGLTGSESS